MSHSLYHRTQLTAAYSPLPDDGEPGIAEYNKELEQRGTPSWQNAPWLYTECYLCGFSEARRDKDDLG